MGVTSATMPSRLLLPHFPELVIHLQPQGPVVEQLPPWLADLLTGQETGEPSQGFQTLAQRLPGLSELVESAASQGQPITGYQSELTDASGNLQRLVLDAYPQVLADGSRSVRVSVQAFPDRVAVDLPDGGAWHGIVGRTAPMRKVFNKIRLYGAVTAPVLVTGETGSGKEGVAQALHQVSARRSGPFVAVNCSAISENLFESELFGHEKGSFTGALRTHKGRFERAHGGTLFLDEIGDIPTAFQAKLLRVLETGTLDRVGGEHPVQVDVRVVAATNRPLEEDARLNRFRADLYYRISALQIHLPPLRERVEDIPDLVHHFIRQLNEKYQRRIAALTPEALHLLQQYWWPGNVRELRNLMERLFAENQSDVIGLRSLKDWYEERVQAVRNGVAYDPRVTALPWQQPIPLGMEIQQATTPAGTLNSRNGDAPANGRNSSGVRTNTNSRDSARETVLMPGEENWASDRARPINVVRSSDSGAGGSRLPPMSPASKTADLTVDQVKQAITAARGNMTQAARTLGIHKATLYRFLKAHNLTRDSL